jgi:hypothetical protein
VEKYSSAEEIPASGAANAVDISCALPLLTLHNPVFVLPVLTLIIITILNDGTIISIAYDKVIPDKKPQRWDLRMVAVAAVTIGLVICGGTVLLLFLALQSNYANYAYDILNSAPSNNNNLVTIAYGGAGWLGKLIDPSRPFLLFGEVQTIMYLQVSVNGFLTVFAARTRGFFFERRPGYALATALVVATGTSTLLSLTVGLHDQAPNPWNYAVEMMALSKRPMAALVTWVFALCLFVVQDLGKILMYKIWDRLHTEHQDRLDDMHRKGAAGRAVHDYDRAARRRAGYARESTSIGRQQSTIGRESSALIATNNTVKQYIERVATLEQQVATLQQQVTTLLKQKK